MIAAIVEKAASRITGAYSNLTRVTPRLKRHSCALTHGDHEQLAGTRRELPHA